MSLAVEAADDLSAEWRRRFLRSSAALGEEAITSDVILTLEEEMAPFVRKVKSFTRAAEGGTHGPATGADFEVHFIAGLGGPHFGYRVQAKLAKREYAPPVFTYDFAYTTRRGTRQIDALIASARASSCVPIYFLYNSPDAVAEVLASMWWARPFHWWRHRGGCWDQHVTRLDAALTISALPARLASSAAASATRKYTEATDVAEAMSPWSCLLHSPSRPGSRASLPVSLTVDGLREQYITRLDMLARSRPLTDARRAELDEEQRLVEEQFGPERPIPDDVARLWQGTDGYTFDDLVRERPSVYADSDEGEGDVTLGSMLIVELEG